MTFKHSLITLALLSSLAACGGGSSSTPAPIPSPTPVLNQAPTVQIESHSIEEQQTISIVANAQDSDGSIASYAWQQTAGPNVELAVVDSATLTFTAPSVEVDTTLTFTLTVTDDDGATASATANVTVTPRPNQAPTVQVAPVSIEERQQVTLTADAQDPDGNIVSVDWEQVDGTSVELTQTNIAELRFNAPEVTEEITLQFKVTVVDDADESAEALVNVTVLPKLLNAQMTGEVATSNPEGIVVAARLEDKEFIAHLDNDGKYALNFFVDDSYADSKVTLTARKQNSAFGLQAEVGSLTSVLQAAGDNNVTESSELPWLHLSALNTATQYVLQRYNADDSAGVMNNFEEKLRNIPNFVVNDVAALIHIANQSDSSSDNALPEGISTTQELLANHVSLKRYNYQIQNNSMMLRQANETIFAEYAPEQISASDVSKAFYMVGSSVSIIWYGLTLQEDGTGTLASAFVDNSNVLWQVSNGTISIDIDDDSSIWIRALGGYASLKSIRIKPAFRSANYESWLVNATYISDANQEEFHQIEWVTAITEDGLIEPQELLTDTRDLYFNANRSLTGINLDTNSTLSTQLNTLGKVTFNENQMTYMLRNNLLDERVQFFPQEVELTVDSQKKTFRMSETHQSFTYRVLRKSDDSYTLLEDKDKWSYPESFSQSQQTVLAYSQHTQLDDQFVAGIYGFAPSVRILVDDGWTWYELNEDGTSLRVSLKDNNADGEYSQDEVSIYRGFWMLTDYNAVRIRDRFRVPKSVDLNMPGCVGEAFYSTDDSGCVVSLEREWEIQSFKNDRLRYTYLLKAYSNYDRSIHAPGSTGDLAYYVSVNHQQNSKLAQRPIDISEFLNANNQTPYIWALPELTAPSDKNSLDTLPSDTGNLQHWMR